MTDLFAQVRARAAERRQELETRIQGFRDEIADLETRLGRARSLIEIDEAELRGINLASPTLEATCLEPVGGVHGLAQRKRHSWAELTLALVTDRPGEFDTKQLYEQLRHQTDAQHLLPRAIENATARLQADSRIDLNHDGKWISAPDAPQVDHAA